MKRKGKNYWKEGGPIHIQAGNSWFYFNKKGIDVVCAGVIGHIRWSQIDKARKLLPRRRGRSEKDNTDSFSA